MKRPVRPLFPVLLLIVVTVTLTCRVAFRTGISQNVPAFVRKLEAIPVINATFAKLAAADLGELQLRQDVEQLLEGNFGSYGRHRSFLSSDRHRHSHENPRGRSFRGISAKLRLPKLSQSLPEFRNNLRNWWRKRRFQGDIMLDLVSLVKIPIDRESTKYSSCAVVGNSGILLNKKYGEFIDSHKAVIRLNNARTKGFEDNVGSKTSVSFINSNILHLCARREGCFCNPYGDTVPLVMYICQPTHFLDYTICNSSQKGPLLVTDPRFDMLCSRIVKYYSLKRFVEVLKKPIEEWDSAHEGSLFHYSSGMQAVMLALGVCDKVSILGFGKLDSAKHHYHTNQKAELHLHDYEAEYDLYRDLVERPEVIPFISDKFRFPPVVMYQ